MHAADELDAAPAAKKGKAATAALTFTTPLGSGLVLTEDDTVATGTDKKAEAGRYCGYMDSFAAVCPIVMQAGMYVLTTCYNLQASLAFACKALMC